jgi:hypothetical protein
MQAQVLLSYESTEVCLLERVHFEAALKSMGKLLKNSSVVF